MGYLYFAIAVIAEVIATSALKASDEFSKLGLGHLWKMTLALRLSGGFAI
ncbi:MAG: hypothetical protein K6L73_12300 [Cellvibrionaceae bacterium]